MTIQQQADLPGGPAGLITAERPNEQVVERLRTAPEDVSVTVVTQAEVLEGRFASSPIVEFDSLAATEFYRLLGTKGMKRIERADLMIASIALAYKATLVTRNLKDYQKIPGLKLENWAD